MNSAPITLGESQVVSSYHEEFRADSPSLTKTSSKKRSRLEDSLEKLAQLISNITESYTTAIFVADQQNKVLHSLAHHSLSRDYIENVTIPFGMGLVGWTAENKVRITVCPFENDASTLLYYPSDQALKSFIAVPILSKNSDLIGVIACDSKKSYAFAKITEKLLTECAAQAQLLIELHLDNQKLSEKAPNPNLKPELEKTFEKLSAAKSEEQLFELLCNVSQNLISRDAFIALVTSHEGYGDATFYSNANESRVEHHLVDLVCKHKKILSTERSVHVLPHDDIRARSFLSAPIIAFNREAGALNVLSAAFKGFSPSDIEALEKLASFIGHELERLRSKAIANSRQVGPTLLPWKHFITQSDLILEKSHTPHSLLRIQLSNLFSLEQALGVKNVAEIHEQLLRFIQQLAPQPMLASSPYGTSTYLFGEASQIEAVSQRIHNIVSKIPQLDSIEFFEPMPHNAASLISDNLEMLSLPIKVGTKSIVEVISTKNISKNATPKINQESEVPQAAQTVLPPINSQDVQKKSTPTSNFQKIRNGFDQRLSNALKVQEEKNRQFNLGKSSQEHIVEEDFILGETTETKEVANARFW